MTGVARIVVGCGWGGCVWVIGMGVRVLPQQLLEVAELCLCTTVQSGGEGGEVARRGRVLGGVEERALLQLLQSHFQITLTLVVRGGAPLRSRTAARRWGGGGRNQTSSFVHLDASEGRHQRTWCSVYKRITGRN